jgi:hypothetical protein
MGLVLAGQVLYHLSHTPSPFCFSYFFQVWSHIFVQAALKQ